MSNGEPISRSETIDRARLPSTRSTLVEFGRMQDDATDATGDAAVRCATTARGLLDRRYKRGS